MCGRYEFNDEKDIEEIHKILQEINNKYKDNNSVSYKTGEIFPTNPAPILSLSDGKMALQIMEWGFPKWDSKGSIINARSETAAEKRMFAKLLLEKRCVIPSTGFYEWQKNSKAKEKFQFNCENDSMLYMAGLYNVFKDGDNIKECFLILTRAANVSIQDIHDRMPVILYKNELKDWLRDDQFTEYAFRRDDIVLERKAV